jgi:Uma2 family endonuclease
MSAARKRATYDDLVRLPDNMVGELIDGELIASARPAIPHAIAGSALGTVIGGPFGFGVNGPGGWFVLYEPELHFADDVLVPDYAGWRRERMPDTKAAFTTLAPDWVCEVISASTERIDRARKARIYAREGVGHMWFVNPITQTLEVYQRAEAGWLLTATHEGDAQVAAAPFDAVPFRLGLLWG